MDTKGKYEDLKLNIFQNGIIVFIVDLIALSLSAYGCYYIFVKFFKENLKNFINVIQINYIDKKTLYTIINNIDILDFDTIYLLFIYTFIPYLCFSFILMLIIHINWSFSIKLPCAIEFRHALDSLAIHGTENGISFLREMKINLYVSSKRLSNVEHDVKAKKFLMIAFKPFLNMNVINRYAGEQRLCLYINDYYILLETRKSQLSESIFSDKTSDTEKINTLNAYIVMQTADIEKLRKENETYRSQLTALEEKEKIRQQTVNAREKKSEQRNIQKIPFWRVAGPMINKMIYEATEGTAYTRPQIQEIFNNEMRNYPALQEDIRDLFLASRQEENGKPFELPRWAMDSIRVGLGECARSESGAPRKTERI